MHNNMKKFLLIIVSVLLILSSLATPAFAKEDKETIQIVSTQIEKADDGIYLKVSAKNTSDIALYNVCMVVTNYDKEKIVFNESAVYASIGLPVGVIAELKPDEEGTVLFQLDGITDPHARLDLGFSFQYKGTTVHAGANNSDENFGECEFTDILKEDNGFSYLEVILNFLKQTGFSMIKDNWKALIMLGISFALIYLAIVKKFEPLLLLPIAFGMLLTNLPGAEMYHPEFFADGHVHWDLMANGAGLIDFLYLGIKLGIYPCLIFLGIGAMTDFGPLIANPKSLLLGAAAQLGIFMTYFGASLIKFTPSEAASIGIIGGADGPTAIFVASKLAPELLGPIAVAAYSYMALVPFIQPPIMKLLTTKKERAIVMKELRPVSKTEKIVFPIVVTIFVALLVPSAAPLVGCLMLGNLMRESGVVDRIAKAAQNELMNIVTIFLGISVGATATAEAFLNLKTLGILAMGIVAFSFGTAGGVLLAKFINLFSKNKINPLIGSAGVSAVPMAARVSQTVGQKENPSNFLLMHAMGPNVAGVIGSAIAAGVLIALFG